MVMSPAVPDAGHEPHFVEEQPARSPGDDGFGDGLRGIPFTIARIEKAQRRALGPQSVDVDMSDGVTGSGAPKDEFRREELHLHLIVPAVRPVDDLDLVGLEDGR